MGAALHGSNGISPVVTWSMYSTYVLTCLLYNLEVLILMHSQTAVLEMFHRATLRSIQGLPDQTSSADYVSSSVDLLLGALPVEAILHARILQLVGKIIMARDTFLHYFLHCIHVQCQMKDIACARIKCKLLTGTYMLQTNGIYPTCPVCKGYTWKTQRTS